MRLSQILISTLRDDPADAEIPSHKLLARAGFVVKIAAGVYTFAPLMWRVVKKFAQIVREELDREGANEVMLPIIQPKELWVSSGRWDRYVTDGIMFTLKDRKGSEMCLGPTHEEVMTAYVNAQVNSYKQLPVNCYQIQDKFRDEIRPRFGLMRGREFIMMDAYSFDADQAGLDEAYAKMRRAYCRIFDRCGVDYTVVQADSGAIGGAGSEEFMVIADSGEDSILFCRDSGYAANVEKANSKLPAAPAGGEAKPLEKHATPDVKTVAQLEAFFPGWVAGRMAKTVLYHVTWKSKEKVVAVMMRGDLEINEVKLVNSLDALTVRLATEDEIKQATGAEVGFAGPVGLPDDVPLLADESLQGVTNLLTGCNQTGYHCLNVNLGRDCRMPSFKELRLARAGEGCPLSGKPLEQARGIEVGHIFKLGTKYSKAMAATFMDQGGKPTPFVMGCYGIGVSRTPAAAIEQHFDDKGMVWPVSIAPFECVVAMLDPKRDEQQALAQQLYEQLQKAGVDVCLDDRPMSPGAKFKDLELIGVPVQVFVGRKAGEGQVEFLVRKGMQKSECQAGEVASKVLAALGR
ncbi:MAG: proline--tRNA ligase [Planctomycetes bacterium]|nr:proline--tRNA ligase [Planctomycetota bacterium]MCC7398882.1 proline--tRNA ligase [Planctomycetota bacterium]